MDQCMGKNAMQRSNGHGRYGAGIMQSSVFNATQPTYYQRHLYAKNQRGQGQVSFARQPRNYRAHEALPNHDQWAQREQLRQQMPPTQNQSSKQMQLSRNLQWTHQMLPPQYVQDMQQPQDECPPLRTEFARNIIRDGAARIWVRNHRQQQAHQQQQPQQHQHKYHYKQHHHQQQQRKHRQPPTHRTASGAQYGAHSFADGYRLPRSNSRYNFQNTHFWPRLRPSNIGGYASQWTSLPCNLEGEHQRYLRRGDRLQMRHVKDYQAADDLWRQPHRSGPSKQNRTQRSSTYRTRQGYIDASHWGDHRRNQVARNVGGDSGGYHQFASYNLPRERLTPVYQRRRTKRWPRCKVLWPPLELRDNSESNDYEIETIFPPPEVRRMWKHRQDVGDEEKAGIASLLHNTTQSSSIPHKSCLKKKEHFSAVSARSKASPLHVDWDLTYDVDRDNTGAVTSGWRQDGTSSDDTVKNFWLQTNEETLSLNLHSDDTISEDQTVTSNELFQREAEDCGPYFVNQCDEPLISQELENEKIQVRMKQLRRFQNSAEKKFRHYLDNQDTVVPAKMVPEQSYPCPMHSSCPLVRNELLLTHFIANHMGDMQTHGLRAIYENERVLIRFAPRCFFRGRNACIAVVAFGGIRDQPNSLPIMRYMPIYNTMLPNEFSTFSGYLPLLVMISRNRFHDVTPKHKRDNYYQGKAKYHYQDPNEDVLALWVVSMELPRPLHVLVTVFNRCLDTTRSAFLEVRGLHKSHNCKDFMPRSKHYMRLTEEDLRILTNSFHEPIYLELSVKEFAID